MCGIQQTPGDRTRFMSLTERDIKLLVKTELSVCLCVSDPWKPVLKREKKGGGVVVLHFQIYREMMMQLTSQTGSLLMDDGVISRVFPYLSRKHSSISTTQTP